MEGMISLVACEHCVQSEINDSHDRLSTGQEWPFHSAYHSIFNLVISNSDLLHFVRTAGIYIAICDSGKETVL